MIKINEPKKVCVLIVSYNFEQWIDKCIKSVLDSSIHAAILVVDNYSIDSTCQILKKKYPEVTLIESKENAGFGKANNIGMEYIINNGFEYAFLLNQDAWIEKNTIEKLLEEAVNPFYSTPKAIAFSLLASIKKATISLFSNKRNYSKEYLKITFKLLKMSRSILHTRKETI